MLRFLLGQTLTFFWRISCDAASIKADNIPVNVVVENRLSKLGRIVIAAPTNPRKTANITL